MSRRGQHLSAGHGGAVVDAGVGAGGRLDVPADPEVEVDEGRAQEWAVVEDVERIAAAGAVVLADAGLGEGPGDVLRTGEVIDAGLQGGLQILFTGGIDVDEGAVAAPVLGGGVGVENLGDGVEPAQAPEQAVPALREGIGHLVVCEGEEVPEARL